MSYLHELPWLPSTPGTPEQLNAIALFKRPDLTELAAVDDSEFVSYNSDAVILCFVPEWGLYSWRGGQTLTADGELVVNTASNQFVLECPHGNAIFTYLEPRLADIESRLGALEP